MNLRSRLAERISMDDIREIAYLAQNNVDAKTELFSLASDGEDTISIHALWIMTHYPTMMNDWLFTKQDELIDMVLGTTNSSRRRLILTLLLKQPLPNPPRVDFLDFCLEIMLSLKETHGVTTLCMKLAYGMCCSIPELLQEYCVVLDTLEPTMLPPSLRTARKNIIKMMQKKKKSTLN